MAETLILKGTMHGHFEDLTAIATPSDNSDIIVSSSNNSILLWTLPKESANSSETAGSTPYSVPRLRLTGHSECVQDVVLSSDGQLALSGSGAGELRLWDVNTGATIRSFVGLTGDVLSVALSADNRQIVSASMDHTIMLWDILGECKYTIQDADGHSDWVNCVRFSPNNLLPTIVSGSWDRTVKVWNPPNYKLKSTLVGHKGFVYTVAVSPDGSVCASGDSYGLILLWDLAVGESLYSLDDNEIINSLCFCPNKHWICAATGGSVKIWDIENEFSVQDLKTDAPTGNNERFYCTRLSWSCDGSTLFTGYTDGTIRVWGFSRSD